MKKTNKKLRSFVAIALVFGMLFFNVRPALALSISWGGLTNILTSVANGYINVFTLGLFNWVKNTINGADYGGAAGMATTEGAQVESAKSKVKGPSVSVTFSADGGIKTGSKITATAATSMFADQSKLYYTWYLKKDGCKLNSSPSAATKAKCDMDGDGNITVNDWKVAAARIIVRGSYDATGAAYASASGDALDGTEADPSIDDWKKSYDPDETNSSDAPNCYVQNPDTGSFLEIRNTTASYACSAGYHFACAKDATISDIFGSNCLKPNPAYDIAAYNAVVAAQAQWDSDRAAYDAYLAAVAECIANPLPLVCPPAPVADPGPRPADYAVPEFIEMTQALNVCQEDSTYVYDPTATPDVGCDGTSICMPDSGASILGESLSPQLAQSGTSFENNAAAPFFGAIFNKNTTQDDMCKRVGDIFYNTNTSQYSYVSHQEHPGTPDGNYSPVLNGNEQITGYTPDPTPDATIKAVDGTGDYFGETDKSECSAIVSASTGLTTATAAFKVATTTTGEENGCKHLYPYYPKKKVVAPDGNNINLGSDKVGDGEFSKEEKEFWGADPTTAATNGIQNDEASVMGLGVDKFTWQYVAGDMVGVVVEGDTTLSSDHIDSSTMRMWAFSNGGCSKETFDDITGDATVYTNPEGAGANYANIGAITFTDKKGLDNCLEENLLEPDDKGTSKMKVDLTAMPANPMNDPDGGDEVTVTAAVTNGENLSQVAYEWSLEYAFDSSNIPDDTTHWRAITPSELDLVPHSLVSGIGDSEFKFRLSFPENVLSSSEPVHYLRAKVKATENLGDSAPWSKGFVVIKVLQQQNKIEAYGVTADTSGSLSLNSAEPICTDPASRTRCYVTKNQIVGLQISNSAGLSGFSWKVNGVPMGCTSSISSACGNGSNNIFFFPILGNEGEAVDVVATASSESKGVVEITRHFVIVAPQVQILPVADASGFYSDVWPKVLGVYKTLGANQSLDNAYPDLSAQVFETNPGKTVTLEAAVYSAWNQGSTYNWTMDGQIQDSTTAQTGNKISFVVDKEPGDSYNVGLLVNPVQSDAVDAQNNNLRRALLKDWGVAPEDSVDQDSSANIQINVISDTSVAAGSDAGQAGIFASLVTHLPQQFMFLLKITLAAFLLILSMGLLFAFIPDSLFRKDERGI